MLDATKHILKKLKKFRPEIGVVLGSGLGFFAEEKVKNKIVIPFKDIPSFPVPTAPGHKGNFVFGEIGGRRAAFMQGRFHYYEGCQMAQVALPVRVMAELGVKLLILTNAAGGINSGFVPGDLMLITDHINLMGTNPLIGPNDDKLGPRFPDMTAVYDQHLIKQAEEIAGSQKLTVRKGVYLAVTGPSFETPAEIRAFRALGADAVGMSTVPEAIAARHAGLKVIGISCIANKAAGLSGKTLSADEVFQTTERIKPVFAKLLENLITSLKF